MKNFTGKPVNICMLVLISMLMVSSFVNAQTTYTLSTSPPYSPNTTTSNTYGLCFNVGAKSAILITKLKSTFSSTGTLSIKVWYKKDSINGVPNISTANGWILHQNVSVSVSQTTSPTEFSLTNPIEIPAGKVYGLYIEGYPKYVSSGSPQFFQDANAYINVGSNVGYCLLPGSTSALGLRQWCGAIVYQLAIVAGFDLEVISIDSPVVFKQGNNTIYTTVRNNRTDTIRWFDIAYQVDNNSPVVVTNHYPASPILINKTYQYKFSTPCYLPNQGTYNIKVWVANANDSTPDNKPANDTIKKTICTGISGTFTIGGSGADFSNFASAVGALKSCGISGPVTFLVSPGTYNERIEIPEIIGTSKNNQIKFLGSGISTCKITYAGTSSAYSTIYLNGADYVTFDGFTIENTGTTYSVGITLGNNANNNVISNNLISVYAGTSSYMIGLRGSASDGSTTAGSIGFNNYIYNNRITGGYYGIYWYNSGSSTSAKTYFNNTYEKNIIDNFYYYGVMMYYNGGTKFKFNKIYQPRYSYAYGLMMYYPAGDTIVSNVIEPGYIGIYYYYYANRYNTNWKTLIANNLIYNFANASAYTCGINIYYYAYYCTVTNNTIWVKSGSSYNNSSSYSGIYAYYSYYCQFTNNIIVNDGYNRFMSLEYPYYSKSDYNLFFYTKNAFGGNPSGYYQFTLSPNNIGTTAITDYNQFISIKETSYLGTHDLNSYPYYDPKLVSDKDLHHITGFKGYLGEFIPGLTYDVDGDTRCAFLTYIGADGPYHEAPTVGFISSDTICQSSPTTFFNTSKTIDPYLVSWYVDNVKKSTDFHFTYTFPSSGTYNVKMAFQSCVRTDTFAKNVIASVPNTYPLTEFMVSKNIVEMGEDVSFFDFSERCPDTWQWEISPSKVLDPLSGTMKDAFVLKNGTTLNSTNPVIAFNYAGSYTISLTTSNTIGTAPKVTKKDYIYVKFSDNLCGKYNETDQKYGTLYDDGGAGNYAANKFCTYLVKPCGSNIEIKFLECNLANKTYLRIYDGFNNNGKPLWNTTAYPMGITGAMNNPKFDTFFYPKETGMFYIEFESDAAVSQGFKLEWTSTGTFTVNAPIAAFQTADSGCVTVPFTYQNISLPDLDKTRFSWDYDGNGIIDDHSIHGKFGPISFPGLTAKYLTRLIAENCAGSDTAEKYITLINPQKAPNAEPMADILRPVVDQDIVTLYIQEHDLSCVDKVEWSISPAQFYFANGTNKYSVNPQVVFTKVDSFDISVIMGNSNTPYSSSAAKYKYITPITYCQPGAASQHADIGISHVKTGNIDNYSMIGQSGYTNFANQYSTELTVDKTFDILIERNTNFNNVFVRVWIDYNMDGTFDDNTEKAVSIDNSSLRTWNTSFHVPLNASLGATTMRVAVGYAGQVGPCGPFKYGEFEDYRVFIRPDNEPPVITILGNNPEYIEQGYVYNDAGATAYDNLQGNVTSRIVTVNNVNTLITGSYMVNYSVCDSLNNCATASRLVVVTKDNTPPVITLYGGDPLSVNVNEPFNDTNYAAYDLVDGDLTSKVIVSHNVDPYKLGEYTINYFVTDNAGLSDSKSRNVIVKDVAPPQISLIGDPVIYLEIMNPFNDPGVSYADNYWPNSKIIFEKSGLVDITHIGTYTITYSVTDFSGNGPNSISRKVIVWDSSAPSLSLNGADEVIIEVNEPWYDPGVTITDNSISGFKTNISGTFYKNFPNVDGKFVPNIIGLYTIFYEVVDAAGNKSEMIPRVVRVVDSKCPQITLLGDLMLSVEKWTPYVDAGYTITDNYYAAKDIHVDTFNNVNIHEPGLYYVTYTATDPSNNNCMTVTRIVRVVYNNVSIDENIQGSIYVYPNPSGGQFTIDLNLPLGSSAQISIVNLLGEEVALLNRGTLFNTRFTADLSAMPSGIYMVKVQTASNTFLEKIVLTK